MDTLSSVKVGERAKVVKIEGEGPLKQRLMDMGITYGVEIFVKGIAPLGDPIIISLRGYNLTIRNQDAKIIFVELLKGD